MHTAVPFRRIRWMRNFLPMSIAMVCSFGLAQQRTEAPRADGSKTPLLVYGPAGPAGSGCADLAIISPGAGGTENGYGYLAKGLRDRGWTAIVVGHKESGPQALRHDVLTRGLRSGLTEMVDDPAAYKARFMDIAAAVQWADGHCRPTFRALLGHSMGARTVMLEAGAKNNLGLVLPSPDPDRFDAFVAMSPSGPGAAFPPNAWATIHRPLLILTGTRDKALNGGWRSRTVPFQDLPPGCHWLGIINHASHMNFAGRGLGAKKTESLALPLIYAFLDGARDGNCALPPKAEGIAVEAK